MAKSTYIDLVIADWEERRARQKRFVGNKRPWERPLAERKKRRDRALRRILVTNIAAARLHIVKAAQ